MKIFKKVLAIILSAVLMLTVLPLSVFADPAPSPAPGTVVQGAKGTGADGTVTLTVSASQLAALIRSLDDGDQALETLKGMIKREGSLVTVEEILDVLPVRSLMDTVIGEHGENLGDLIDRLGGIDRVLTLVDVDALIASADADELADFAAGINGVETVVDTAKLRDYLSGLSADDVKALFGSNFNAFADAIADAIVNGTLTDNNGNPLTISDLVDFAVIDPGDFQDEIANNGEILTSALRDMLDAGVAIPSDSYNVYTDRLTTDSAIQNRLIADLRDNANKQILTAAGISKAAELFADEAADAMGETNLQALLGNSQVVNALVSYINNDLEHNAGNNAKALLNAAGQAWLDDQINNHGLTSFTAAEIETIRNNAYYNVSSCAARVADIVVNETTLDLADYVDVDALLASATMSSAKINELFGTAANYNAANLFSTMVNAISAENKTLSDFVSVNVSALVNDSGVSGFFRNHVTDYFSAAEIVDILGNKLSDCVKSDIYFYNSMVAVAKNYISVSSLLHRMNADGETITDYVDVDAMLHLPGVDYGELFNLFDTDVLVDQLKDDYRAIFGALTGEQKKRIVMQIVTAILEQFGKVTVEGYTVAENDGNTLMLNAEALVAAVWEVLPKLSELADENFNGTILSFNVTADYTTQDGAAKHKDVNVVFRVESGVGAIRRAAALLDRYISVEKNGNRVNVELNVPGAIADLYRKVLETGDTEAINSLREKILAMESMTGVDLVDAFADITFSEIIAALRDVDVNELYERLINAGIVQRVADKLEELAGVNYDLSKIDTLDELLDQLRRDDLPTVETIVGKLSDKLNADLMAMLEKVAKVADEKGYTEKLIEKAKSLPKIGQYLDGITAEQVLNDYKGMNPVKAVATFLSDRVGRDLVSKVYSDDTAEELYQKGLDYAEAHLADAYNSFRNLVVNLSDPDYNPTNRFAKLLQSFIPAKALSAFRSHSLTEIYRGNGEFSATADSVSISLDSIIDRLFSLVKSRWDLDSDTEATLRGFLPSGTLDFGVSFKVDFAKLYQVTYYHANGEKLLTTFLPQGVDPTVVKVPALENAEVKGWADAAEDGNLVHSIEGDCNLYATYEEDQYTVTFRFFNGETYTDQIVTVGEGKKVSAIPANPLPENLVAGGYTVTYFVGDAVSKANETIAESEILNAEVTANVTYSVAYLPKGLVEDAEELVYLTTDANDNWTATVLDASDFNVTVNMTNPAFNTAKSIKVQSGTVAMEITPALLNTIKAEGTGSIRLVSKRADSAKSFAASNGIYTASTEEAYDLQLLVDESPLASFGDRGLAVTVKTASITPVVKNDQQQTAAYIVDENGVLTADDLGTTVSTTDQSVTFYPPHFTEIVIVNEYRLTAEFDGTVQSGTLKVGENGTAVGTGIMIPEGATVKKLVPSIGAAGATNVVDKMTYAGTEIEIGGNFTMPGVPAAIRVTSAARQFGFLYCLPNGTVLDDLTAANNWLAQNLTAEPVGYHFAKDSAGNFLWENADLDPQALQATVYCTPALTPITYDIIFQPGHGAENITAHFTIEDAQNGTFLPPAMPEIDGYTPGAWASYDLLAIINGTAQNVVTGTYTERTYTVTYPNGTTAEVKMGTTINATTGYTPTAGYEIDKIVYISEDGTETEVNGTTFAMPAGAVRIVITERGKTVPVIINGETYRGTLGGVFTFEVELKGDEVLAKAPAGARLISFRTGRDDSRTLVFAVDVTENMPEITYRVGARDAASEGKINNGLLGGDEDSRAIRYNTTKDLTFPSAVYSVAVYENEGALHSLAWLLILLIILLVIAVIALLYVIIIRKGLGPNFFTRLIVGIVTVFFTMCLGVYAFFSGETFRKKKDEKPTEEEEKPTEEGEDENAGTESDENGEN